MSPKRTAPARRLAAVAATAAALLAAPSAARAADYTVTGTGDGGSCAGTSCDSLRAAVDAASGDLEIDRIFLSGLSGTITLGSQLPTTLGGIEVHGPGATTLAVSGDDSHRIFDVGGFANLTISGLTLRDGDAGDAGSGGAIRVGVGGGLSALTLRGSVVTANEGDFGGGIAADGSGGGVQVTIEGSTITGNQASSGGGVGMDDEATLTIRRSTISGNRAVSGGAVNFLGASAPAATTIEASTIADNRAEVGGGIVSDGATLTSTIVAGNTADSIAPDLGTPTGGDPFRSSFSLIGDTSGGTVNNLGGSHFNKPAQLGPLQSNGGPTPTHSPALTSPAIDAGRAAGPDQRGFPRPVNQPTLPLWAGSNAADIGAVELPAVLPPNHFSFGKLKRKKRKGVARLRVWVPFAGEVALFGKKVKNRSRQAAGPGLVVIPIKARGKKRKRLKRKGKAKVGFRVRFTPRLGHPNTKHRRVKLVKKRKRR